MNEIPIYNIDGSEKTKIQLPKVFSMPYRPDVIHRVFLAQRSHLLQPQGRDPLAGERTSAISWQTGRGVARVPRVKGEKYSRAGMAAGVASVVKGRLPHPPKAEKVIHQKVNRKERLLALASAIGATSRRDVVEARGHKIYNVPSLPFVVSSDFEKLTRAKDVLNALKLWGLEEELHRIEDGIKRKSRRSQLRGRVKQVPVGPLIVVTSSDSNLKTAAENIPGFRIVDVNSISVFDLVPGGHPIRFVIWTESSVSALNQKFGDVI